MNDDRGLISRRSLLVGGAALVGGSAAVVERVGPTRILRKFGLAHSPDHSVPPDGAAVERFTFPSSAMKGNVGYAIAMPEETRGVIICLHPRGGGRLTAFNDMHVHDVVAAAKVPLAVVGVEGGADTYWHKRRSGVDPQAMLHDELLPRIDEKIGASVPRALLGWSMGGYGALLTAERHPDEYTVVVGCSPALWTSAGATAPGAFDDADDYRRNDVFAGVPSLGKLTVRVDCGTHDPFLAATRTFVSRLPEPHLGSFTEGFHDDRYWRTVAPAQIQTIAKALLG